MAREKKHIWWPAFAVYVLSLLLFVSCGFASGVSPQDQTRPWRFAVVADTQGSRYLETDIPYINKEVLTMIAADMVERELEFVLVAGDLVSGWLHNGGVDYETQFAVWKEVMRPVYDAGIEIYPIRGNHEDGPERFVLSPLPERLEPPEGFQAALRCAFLKAFDQEYIPQNGPDGEVGLTYSFSYRNALIIGMDEYVLHQHTVNQAWFEAQIAAMTQTHLFVFGHEPAYGVNHQDNLSFYEEDRDLFWDTMGSGGGRLYFCGHDHMYNRAAVSDSSGNIIRQIIVGTGGGHSRTWSGDYPGKTDVTGEFHMENMFGYVIVTVDGPCVAVEWRAISDEGPEGTWKVRDTFSYENTDDEKNE